jgi:molybdopterin synthase catalytic subunit
MRIVHIAGLSGSGKTTFIRRLLPLLQEIGPVAVIKHMGHHVHALDPGKDTTVFFDAGIVASVGIDPEKSVMVVREPSLPLVLTSVSCLGIENTVIEGFKFLPIPKVVIGDYPGASGVILKNPSPRDVIGALPRFAEFHTMDSVTRELAPESRAVAAAAWTLTLQGEMREVYQQFSPIEKEIRKAAGSMPGHVRVRVRIHPGHLFGGEDTVLMAVGADSHACAITALTVLRKHLPPALLSGQEAQ